MHRAIWLALLISALLAAGCTAGTTVSLNTPVAAAVTAPAATEAPTATAVPATTAPAAAPALPVAATEPVIETIPSPAAPTAAATGTTAPQATAGAGGTPVTFTSTRLGISFSYLPGYEGMKVGVQEAPDRVYVYLQNTAPEAGQWVRVFHKPAGQSLEEAIKAQVLTGYAPQNCVVLPTANPENGQQWPAGYTFATMTPAVPAGSDLGTRIAAAGKCPQPYAAVGGLAYFIADAAHPEQFAFVSIGQYGIPAGPQRPWQVTLRFLGTGTAAATPQPTQSASAAPYIDDRSSAAGVITSYFNAINHYEYSRAYGYWNPGAGQANGLPPFAQFRAGYSATKSVALTLGTVLSDAGAGQLYYAVPVALLAENTDGTTQAFAGCYKLHLAQPGIQGVPPFQPLAIESASVQAVAGQAAALNALAGACAGFGQPLVTAAGDPGDISASRYVDDRSDATGVLRSLFNAINRKEYVRAYAYWEASSPQRLPFDQFSQGYADTASVALTLGPSRPGAAAGNIYYQAPVVLTAQNRDGSRQTFAGCYTLHMANPGMQTEPPFASLGIQSATVRLVPNGSDAQALLASACNQ